VRTAPGGIPEKYPLNKLIEIHELLHSQ